MAQPALGALEMGIFRLLGELGVEPDLVGGHSYGEDAALCSAGTFNEAALAQLSHARGRCIKDSAGGDAGAMAAVSADVGRVRNLIDGLEHVWIANSNAPQQTVISGGTSAVDLAIERIEREGVPVRRLLVSCAFHSPMVAAARDSLARVLSVMKWQPPRIGVFRTARRFSSPEDSAAALAIMADHLVSPVRFAEQVTECGELARASSWKSAPEMFSPH